MNDLISFNQQSKINNVTQLLPKTLYELTNQLDSIASLALLYVSDQGKMWHVFVIVSISRL